jgi:AsmA protein
MKPSEPRSRRWPKVLGIVAAVLVVIGVVGVLALDRILTSVAHRQAARLSQQLGREVAVESVSTKFLGGLGVKVSGVRIGPGPGEGVALLELGRAEVEVALLRALLSKGTDLRVHEAVISGLRVNVEKLPDGTTNAERLAKRLKEGQGAAEQPQPEETKPGQPAQPRSLEVGRAAVEHARIAFIDRTVPGAKELFVDQLDAEVRDVAVGRPLELVVKAAVLASAQNLELRVKAAPLPATLLPTPEQVTLKVQPIALDALAPFLPKSVGLQGGRFQADLSAALGAAVPGGQGKTTLKGGFKATQLAFAGQAGGKKLDASLDADVSADAAAGDLSIGKLELVVGPAALTGHGRASGLRGEKPQVEGLELVSRGLDPAVVAEYFPPLRKMMGGVVVAGPIGLSVHGEGSQAAQRLTLRVDLGPVRLLVPGQLEKTAGAPLALEAGADVGQGGDRVVFTAGLDLAGADLRPGGTLAKKPGDPLSVKAAGSYHKTAQGMEVTLSRLDLDLLGDALQGKGSLALAGQGKARTTRFDAELSGDRLDVDRLLLPSSKEAKKPEKKEEKPASPDAFAGLSGEARLRLGLLRAKGVDLRNVLAKVKVKEDLVTLDQAQLEAFGGTVNAAGTLARLAHGQEPFKVLTKLKNVEAEQVLGLFSKQKVLSGALDLDLQLDGPGLDRPSLAKALTGALNGELRGGTFHGKDLVASVAAPLAEKLPFAKKLAGGGSTSLGKVLPFAVQIANGVARLSKPLEFDTGEGKVALQGGVRLDGGLDMPTTVALSPAMISKLTGGKVKLDAPVPLGFTLTGQAWSPRLEGLSVDAAAKAIASQAATGAIGKALGLGSGGEGGKDAAPGSSAKDAKKGLEDAAKKKLEGLFGK